VPGDAQWCSLCFTDLREPAPVVSPEPAAAPEPEPVGVAAAPGAVAAAVGGTATSSAARAAAADALLATATTAPVADAEVGAGGGGKPVTWPCQACGETVAIELDACPSCGSGFLSGASSEVSVRLPVLGDIGGLSRSQRLLAGLGVSLVVMVILVLLATIGGHFL
jgi:hypothetical protein